MVEHESFLTLLKDPAHWQFEIFLIFIFDVLIGALIWPYVQKFFKHHQEDDNKIRELEERIRNLEGK